MTDTPARLLRLLSLLQTQREWPGSELAHRLQVSPRTIRRDVERLRDLGYPVQASMGALGGYRLVAGTAMPPLLLDDEEAVAITVGLRLAAGPAIAGVAEASVRALGKLEQILPGRLRYRVRTLGAATVAVAGDGPSVSPEKLTVLSAAVSNQERVRFRYQTSELPRMVEPLGLVAAGRRWYLVAFDLDRQGWRTFRLDRIEEPQATGVRFTPRELPAADAAAYVAGERSDWGTPTYRVAVTLQTPAASAAGRLGEAPGELQPVDERRCRLVGYRDDSMTWLAHRIVMLGCEFEVHEPLELARCLREVADRALRGIAGSMPVGAGDRDAVCQNPES